jgi:hypothetical protein
MTQATYTVAWRVYTSHQAGDRPGISAVPFKANTGTPQTALQSYWLLFALWNEYSAILSFRIGQHSSGNILAGALGGGNEPPRGYFSVSTKGSGGPGGLPPGLAKRVGKKWIHLLRA